MKRYHAGTITEHPEGCLALFEDAAELQRQLDRATKERDAFRDRLKETLAATEKLLDAFNRVSAEGNRMRAVLVDVNTVGPQMMAELERVTKERDLARAALVLADARINFMVEENEKRGGR